MSILFYRSFAAQKRRKWCLEAHLLSKLKKLAYPLIEQARNLNAISIFISLALIAYEKTGYCLNFPFNLYHSFCITALAICCAHPAAPGPSKNIYSCTSFRQLNNTCKPYRELFTRYPYIAANSHPYG